VWLAFTDLLVLNLAKNKRYWWSIFRCVTGLELAWFTAALWIEDLDSQYVEVTGARIALNLIRCLWGLVDCCRYGPHLDHWLCFIQERREFHKTIRWYNWLTYGHLAAIPILWFLPHFGSLTMWKWDVKELDGPIVGCLATHGFTCFVKWYTLEV